MAQFDIFKNDKSKQFVTEKEFRDNLNMQVAMVGITLNLLQPSDQTQLQLEFFFYSRTQEKAEQLSEELKKLNYEVEVGKSAGNKDQFLITGWTMKMDMDDQTVKQWAKEMCEIGYRYDCRFDGWGTTPDQDFG